MTAICGATVDLVRLSARGALLTYVILGVLFWQAMVFPQYSFATILFADDFELPGWTPATAGWTEPSGVPSLEVTTTNPFSGTHSAEANLDPNVLIRGLKKVGIDWSEIYVRWFTYYGPGFQWPREGNHVEGMAFQAQASDANSTWGFYNNGAASPGLLMTAGSPIVIESGHWYCLELHIKGGNAGQFEGWVDGVRKWNYPNVDLGTGPIQSLELMSASNVTPPVTETQWLDDVVVSDQRVGCTPPSLSLAAPTAGASVSKTITVAAVASAEVGINSVQFHLDGQPLGAEVVGSPYALAWDTTTVSNGPHTLLVVALDAAGNQTAFQEFRVVVDNPPPTIGAVHSLNVTAEAATVTWTTDEPMDSQVEYGPTPAYGSATPLSPSLVTAHVVTLPDLAERTVYHYRVQSRDAAGNLAMSGPWTFTTLDRTPPTVALTAPPARATVAGPITVAASATDPGGVAGVQFQVDGASLGAEVTGAPYAIAWDTLGVSNGAHTLTAVARDGAGNVGTASVAVTVGNDTLAPMVSITAPLSGATVAGVQALTAEASDNVGVVGVQFKVDGVPLGGEVTAAPYAFAWNTTTVPNGAHTLTAVAWDPSGNLATSSAVPVTVTNDRTPPVISAASAATLTPSAATISWATDEASDSQVEYGPTPAYGSAAPLSPTLVTAHVVTLPDLAERTVYHYRVQSRDAAGNLATSGPLTFTTAPFATATILFADDFELPGWTAEQAGWSGQTGGAQDLVATTSNPAHGSQSGEASWSPGTTAIGLAKFNLNWNNIYARWYTYYGSGFQWPVSPHTDEQEFRVDGTTPSEDLHFISRTLDNSPHWTLISIPSGLSGGPDEFRMNVGPEIIVQAQQWYCLELHLRKGNPGVFEGWVVNRLRIFERYPPARYGYSRQWRAP